MNDLKYKYHFCVVFSYGLNGMDKKDVFIFDLHSVISQTIKYINISLSENVTDIENKVYRE